MNSKRYASGIMFTLLGVGVAAILASCISIHQNKKCVTNCDAEMALDKNLEVSVPGRGPAPGSTGHGTEPPPRDAPPAADPVP